MTASAQALQERVIPAQAATAQADTAIRLRAEELSQFIVFTLGKNEYAVDIESIKEIVKTDEITPVPNTPGFIKGIYNLRGKIVIVIDLKERFSLDKTNNPKFHYLIVADLDDTDFAIISDSVTEILRLSENKVQSAFDLSSVKIQEDYVKGVIILPPHDSSAGGARDTRFIVVIDLMKILSDEEFFGAKDDISNAQCKLPKT